MLNDGALPKYTSPPLPSTHPPSFRTHTYHQPSTSNSTILILILILVLFSLLDNTTRLVSLHTAVQTTTFVLIIDLTSSLIRCLDVPKPSSRTSLQLIFRSLQGVENNPSHLVISPLEHCSKKTPWDILSSLHGLSWPQVYVVISFFLSHSRFK